MATKNDFTTLVSLRIKNELLEKLDAARLKNCGGSRSAVVNRFLEHILKHTEDKDLLLLVNAVILRSMHYKIKVEIS